MNIEKINFCAVKRTNDNSSKKNIASNAMPQNSYNNFSKEACTALKSINFGSNAETGKFKAQNLIGRAGGNLRTIKKELTKCCFDLNRGRISKLELADNGIINIANQVLNDLPHNRKNEVMNILRNPQQGTTEDGNGLLKQYDGYNLQRRISKKNVHGKRIITMTEFSNTPEIPRRVSTYIPNNKSLTVKVYSYPDVCSTYVYDLTKDEDKELKSYSEAPIGKKNECNFKLSFKDGRLQSAIFGIKRNKEGITTIDKIFNFKANSTNPSSVISNAEVCKNGLIAQNCFQFNEFGYIYSDKPRISEDSNSDMLVKSDNIVVVKKDGHRFKADKINFTDTGCELEGNVYEFEGNKFIGLTNRVNI